MARSVVVALAPLFLVHAALGQGRSPELLPPPKHMRPDNQTATSGAQSSLRLPPPRMHGREAPLPAPNLYSERASAPYIAPPPPPRPVYQPQPARQQPIPRALPARPAARMPVSNQDASGRLEKEFQQRALAERARLEKELDATRQERLAREHQAQQQRRWYASEALTPVSTPVIVAAPVEVPEPAAAVEPAPSEVSQAEVPPVRAKARFLPPPRDIDTLVKLPPPAEAAPPPSASKPSASRDARPRPVPGGAQPLPARAAAAASLVGRKEKRSASALPPAELRKLTFLPRVRVGSTLAALPLGNAPFALSLSGSGSGGGRPRLLAGSMYTVASRVAHLPGLAEPRPRSEGGVFFADARRGESMRLPAPESLQTPEAEQPAATEIAPAPEAAPRVVVETVEPEVVSQPVAPEEIMISADTPETPVESTIEAVEPAEALAAAASTQAAPSESAMAKARPAIPVNLPDTKLRISNKVLRGDLPESKIGPLLDDLTESADKLERGANELGHFMGIYARLQAEKDLNSDEWRNVYGLEWELFNEGFYEARRDWKKVNTEYKIRFYQLLRDMQERRLEESRHFLRLFESRVISGIYRDEVSALERLKEHRRQQMERGFVTREDAETVEFKYASAKLQLDNYTQHVQADITREELRVLNQIENLKLVSASDLGLMAYDNSFDKRLRELFIERGKQTPAWTDNLTLRLYAQRREVAEHDDETVAGILLRVPLDRPDRGEHLADFNVETNETELLAIHYRFTQRMESLRRQFANAQSTIRILQKEAALLQQISRYSNLQASKVVSTIEATPERRLEELNLELVLNRKNAYLARFEAMQTLIEIQHLARPTEDQYVYLLDGEKAR